MALNDDPLISISIGVKYLDNYSFKLAVAIGALVLSTVLKLF